MMGRKRLAKTKKTVGLSIDQDLLDALDLQLKQDEVTRSRLFSVAAKVYLRKKRKLNNNLQNKTK